MHVSWLLSVLSLMYVPIPCKSGWPFIMHGGIQSPDIGAVGTCLKLLCDGRSSVARLGSTCAGGQGGLCRLADWQQINTTWKYLDCWTDLTGGPKMAVSSSVLQDTSTVFPSIFICSSGISTHNIGSLHRPLPATPHLIPFVSSWNPAGCHRGREAREADPENT
ncbi:hypothetical protein F5B20DRAFT_430757 [Whalleya microplaca]|nr:hypothetical protein F5B20DRAFT_430757 [Whalleya microplaca]